jgi:hypothetical protein
MPPASRKVSSSGRRYEIKDIRDKALALEPYSRQARNTEAERQACEIRLRAERKAGQLLAAVPEGEFEVALAAPQKPSTSGVIAAADKPPVEPMDERALWPWGRLCDFGRLGVSLPSRRR